MDRFNGKEFYISCPKESENVLENIFREIIHRYCESNDEAPTTA